LFGHFVGLHPEYEVADWRNMKFFVDYMFITGNVRIAFEIKGYGSHVQNTDRTRYRRELNREMFLQGLGCIVVSIPYDDIEENPELIRMLIKAIIAQHTSYNIVHADQQHHRVEQELITMALRTGKTIRPIDGARECGISRQTATKYLKQLCEKEIFRAVSSGSSGRTCKYEYIGPFHR
jgi:hypothetical protein